MTREEAIAILDLSKLTAVSGRKYDEAIDVAIEALSADTVSRETYHNLVTASNDIDRALREYQDKEENGELVSVVRCKDCKHRDPEDERCDHGAVNFLLRRTDNDYCSYGERKGGGDVANG